MYHMERVPFYPFGTFLELEFPSVTSMLSCVYITTWNYLGTDSSTWKNYYDNTLGVSKSSFSIYSLFLPPS